jgi:hypothetical protein
MINIFQIVTFIYIYTHLLIFFKFVIIFFIHKFTQLKFTILKFNKKVSKEENKPLEK